MLTKRKASRPASVTSFVAYLAVAVAIAFWFADAAFTSWARPEVTFWHEVIHPSAARIGMRISVGVAIVLLSFYLQYLLSQNVDVGHTLVESIDLNQRIIEATPAGIIRVARDGKVTSANVHAQNFLGLSYDNISDAYVSDWETTTIWEDGSPCLVDEYPVSRCLETGEPQSPVTIGVVHPDEDFVMWGIFSASPLFDPIRGEQTGAVVTVIDITSRKHIEQALKESEERYKLLVEHLPEGIAVHTDGNFVYVNQAGLKLLGAQSMSDLAGRKVLSLIPEEMQDMISERMRKVLEEKKPAPLMRETLITLQGDYITAEITGVPVSYRGKPSIMVMMRDITEKVKVEDDLRQSQQRMKSVLNAVPDLFFLFDRDGTYLDVSAGRPEDLVVPKEQVVGMKIAEALPRSVASEALRKIRSAIDGEGEQSFLYTLDLPSGRAEFEARIMKAAEGEALAIVRNVTEARAAERKLQDSLSEKEALLKEIHHRVKNNLQVISSLLNLQSNFVEDQATRQIFVESQNRVKSMSMIHEELYKSENLAEVDLKEYVNRLANTLLRTYKIDSSAIEFRFRADDIHLSIDAAIPCGLIVNELISNILKHAFPGERLSHQPGIVEIELRRRENTVELVISDNGVGMPESVDVTNARTLGLQLVNTLVAQLGAEMRVERGAGTLFCIAFDPNRAQG